MGCFGKFVSVYTYGIYVGKISLSAAAAYTYLSAVRHTYRNFVSAASPFTVRHRGRYLQSRVQYE